MLHSEARATNGSTYGAYEGNYMVHNMDSPASLILFSSAGHIKSIEIKLNQMI